MTRERLAGVLLALGTITWSVGAGVAFGPGTGLIVAGVLVVAFGLLLAFTDGAPTAAPAVPAVPDEPAQIALVRNPFAGAEE